MSGMRRTIGIIILVSVMVDPLAVIHGRPLILAHRGASGYVVEHTAEAYAMAHVMKSDYIEMDVVLSRDGIPILLHDLTLDSTTDVAERFPDRAREDGRFYAIDFDWEELATLRKWERFDPVTRRVVYPDRFPPFSGNFRLQTLEQSIQLIQGLNRSSGREVGICPELKSPAFHSAAGQDLTAATIAVLERYGYLQKGARCIIQCFDPSPLISLRSEYGDRVRLVQLIGENAWNEAAVDFDAMRTPDGLKRIAAYADGIGPHWPQMIRAVGRDEDGPIFMMQAAREAGLQVYPYTMRREGLPFRMTLDQLHRLFLIEQPVDGVFTDFPDLALELIHSLDTPPLP
jgi:glycerophosphoryl diester phosphodiesterase